MMKYYIQIFKQVAIISTSSMLAYRSNVLFFFLFEVLFMAGSFGSIALGVQLAGGALGGWNLDEVMFIAALFNMGHQFFSSLFLSGIFHTGWFVWSGRMDFVLLKPLHPLVGMHAATEFVISNIPNLLISVALLGAMLMKLLSQGLEITFIGSLGMLIFFIAGMGVRYGVGLLVVGPSFFAEKLAEGEDAYWSLQSLGKYPRQVYPRLMQWALSFILPLGTLASVPSEIFFGRMSLGYALIHLVFSIVFTYLALKFYELGAKRYQSVNTGA